MATERPLRRYRDIVEACTAILDYIDGYDETRYLMDSRTRASVERQLQKVSEAAARLGATAETELPDQPWRRIRALGNVLRHDYGTVNDRRIWALVAGGDLAALREAVAAHLAKAGDA